MISHRNLRMAAAIVSGGALYLGTPARAAILEVCSELQWRKALTLAADICQGQASVVADCVDGNLIIREIYCY